MLIKDILSSTSISFSFEFFPPKTPAGLDHLFETIGELMPLKPSSVSVTYGAGGTTRDKTHDLVVKIQEETDLTVVSHLTCVGSGRDEIRAILEKYDGHGITNILALKGDAPEGLAWQAAADGFEHAADLVAFIRKHFPHMGIGVAGFPEGHPQSNNRIQEIDFLKAKVDAGADYIVTQLFFDNRDFYDFRERCELGGIRVPIIAGIMPISGRANMLRMAELSPRSRIPAALMRSIYRAGDDDHVEQVGIHWATEQVRDLIDNDVRGVHIYTLNKAKAALKIYEHLGVNDSAQLAD